MSLYGMMRTGSSGMNAQASRLSTVADNIANAGTTGYKAASTEFSSLLLPSVGGNYNSGAVQTDVRYGISNQGALQYTSSGTDLAINGNGFFVVQDPSGVPYMTRAGSFVPNGNGELVNAGGYKLLGYPYTADAPTPVVNGYAGLEPVTIASDGLVAIQSSFGEFFANLDASSDVVTGNKPQNNAVDSKYTHKSSLKTYDSLGNEILFDIYFTKTEAYTDGSGPEDKWEVTMFKASDRNSASGGFPYASGPISLNDDLSADPATIGGNVAMTLTVDHDTGKIKLIDNGSGDVGPANPDFGKVKIGGIPGIDGLTLDFSQSTQLNYDFSVGRAEVNGNGPSEIEQIQIADDGVVYAQYENGDLVPMYRLAMATVQSPDELRVISGNVYAQSNDSGIVILGFPNSNGMGSIVSGALEDSTVDIAEELTRMIESQRTYTANSKVFQTGSDLMDVLVNLKR